MSQTFNFSFSGDDIDNDFNGTEFNVPNGEPPETTPSTARLIEPQLHTLEKMASRFKSPCSSKVCCLFNVTCSCVSNFKSLSVRIIIPKIRGKIKKD